MLTDLDMRRWSSLMLITALRGDLRPETIAQHISCMRHRHGPEVFEEIVKFMLVEARRIGPGHCDGSLYRTVKNTTRSSVNA